MHKDSELFFILWDSVESLFIYCALTYCGILQTLTNTSVLVLTLDTALDCIGKNSTLSICICCTCICCRLAC